MKSLFGLAICLAMLGTGCGGGGTSHVAAVPPPLPVTSGVSSPVIAGNWQFGASGTTASFSLTIAGNISSPTAGVLAAAFHIGGSACFDPSNTVMMTGTLTGTNFSMTSASAAGQVITLTGSVTATNFFGSYNVAGGCANGAAGQITGYKVPSVSDVMSLTFTSSAKETFTAMEQLTEGSASAEGTFPITGTPFEFSSICFHTGTISTAGYPSGSFVLGTSVTLRIETDNGTIVFHGVLDPSTRRIVGDYSVTGGSCVQGGTAVLIGSGIGAWDY